MDAYKELKAEYNGICSIIKEYTSEGDVNNYLQQLGLAIDEYDYDLIIYCLNKLTLWYEENIQNIINNEFVYNKEIHFKNKKTIESLYSKIKDLDSDKIKRESSPNYKGHSKKIFLSHCSKDSKYGDALRAFLIGLGIKNSQLVYTSHSANKIPVGKNIFDYLRENINSNVFVIILISSNYLDNPSCLNEMGAAWVVNSDYLCFFTSDFEFDNPRLRQCAIDTNKMGAILKNTSNCRTSMIEFKNIICEQFDLEVDEKTTSSLIDEFIENITK